MRLSLLSGSKSAKVCRPPKGQIQRKGGIFLNILPVFFSGSILGVFSRGKGGGSWGYFGVTFSVHSKLTELGEAITIVD